MEDGNFSRHQQALGGPGGDKVPSGMGVPGATDTVEGCYAALRAREARALGRGLVLGAVLPRTHVRRAWLERACWRGQGGGWGEREQQQKRCPIAWGPPAQPTGRSWQRAQALACRVRLGAGGRGEWGPQLCSRPTALPGPPPWGPESPMGTATWKARQAAWPGTF